MSNEHLGEQNLCLSQKSSQIMAIDVPRPLSKYICIILFQKSVRLEHLCASNYYCK